MNQRKPGSGKAHTRHRRTPSWRSWVKGNLGIVVFALGALLAIVSQLLHFLGYVHSHR